MSQQKTIVPDVDITFLSKIVLLEMEAFLIRIASNFSV